MKQIYISRPLDIKLKNNIKLIERDIIKLLTSKKLFLDASNTYEFMPNKLWLDEDEIDHKNIKEIRLDLISKRISIMKLANHVLFLDAWLSYPECKIDLDTLDSIGGHNYTILNYNCGEINISINKRYDK